MATLRVILLFKTEEQKKANNPIKPLEITTSNQENPIQAFKYK